MRWRRAVMAPSGPSRADAPAGATPEAFVAWLWQRRAFADAWLRLVDGTRLRRFAHEPAPEPATPAWPRDPAQVAALLEAAGLRRFLARSARLEADLSCTAAEQVLYRELLVALGYSANKTPAGRLAELLPY